MRLAGNTGRKNDAKNRHLRTIAQICRANFNGFRILAALLHGTLVGGVSQIAALNLYSAAGRPSHWALAHISSYGRPM